MNNRSFFRVGSFQVSTNGVLRGIFYAILLVLWPHTTWAFYQFEPVGTSGRVTAGVAAFAFEAAIAVLTEKLAAHISATPRRASGWKKFSYRYLNWYMIGLFLALVISAIANLSHAVEFGRGMAIFSEWGIDPRFYAISFGAILPFVSLTFARVLANVNDYEEETNEEAEAVRKELREVRRALKASEEERTKSEARAKDAEARFNAAGDLMARVFAGPKKDRIRAIRSRWPELPAKYIALLAESSPSFVSETLKEVEDEIIQGEFHNVETE